MGSKNDGKQGLRRCKLKLHGTRVKLHAHVSNFTHTCQTSRTRVELHDSSVKHYDTRGKPLKPHGTRVKTIIFLTSKFFLYNI